MYSAKSNGQQSIFFLECNGSDENKYFKSRKYNLYAFFKNIQYFENIDLNFHYSEHLI